MRPKTRDIIEFFCTRCGHPMQAASNQAGHQLPCAHCQTSVRVPPSAKKPKKHAQPIIPLRPKARWHCPQCSTGFLNPVDHRLMRRVLKCHVCGHTVTQQRWSWILLLLFIALIIAIILTSR